MTPQSVTHGFDASEVEAIALEGYEFVKWSDDVTDNPRTITDVQSNLILIAEFQLKTYSVEFIAGEGGSISGISSQSVVHNLNSTEVEAVALAGYEFVKWSDDVTDNPRTLTNVTEDISLTAEFTLIGYAVEFLAGEGGSISGPASQTVLHDGSSEEVEAVASAGYEFVKWSDDVTDNPRTLTNVTEDISLTAEFALAGYSVEFIAGSGGTITGDLTQIVAPNGSTTEVEAKANSGYFFKEWSDGVTDNPRVITDVTSDLTLTAVFELEPVVSFELEFAQVVLTDQWQTVSYTKAFVDPVVVVGPPTDTDPDPVTVRVKNRTATGFDVRLDEWDYQDDAHSAETVTFMVVERGRHTLPGGKVLEAGTVELTGSSFSTVDFKQIIPTAPIVVSQIVSTNGSMAASSRSQNVSNSSFEIQLEVEEANGSADSSESVDYIAVEQGMVTVAGYDIHVKKVSPVDERNKLVALNEYSMLFAGTHTVAGGDAGSLRMTDNGDGTVNLRFEEEQSKDSEVRHANETAGVILIKDEQAPFEIEIGQLSVDGNWQTVSFNNNFTDPIVVAGPHTSNDSAFSEIRIRNVTSTDFEICIKNWDYLGGVHGLEDVHYMIMEKGRYTFPNGSKIEAGETLVSDGSFSTVNFLTGFSSAPALFSSVVTENDTELVTRRVQNIKSSSFQIRLQEQDTADQIHAEESVHFIAISYGGLVHNGKDYLISSVYPIDEKPKTVDVSGYDSFIASPQTYAGSDNGVLRMSGDIANGIELIFEEEQSKDTELAHVNETAAILKVKDYVEEPEIEVFSLYAYADWQKVNLTKSFTDPVVLVGPAGSHETDPVTIRIRNVTPSSFEVRLQEFEYLDQLHGLEKVAIVVLERGEHTFPSGRRLVADSVKLSNSSDKSVNLPSGFSSNPIVFATVASDNDMVPVMTRISGITGGSFKIRLQEAEINNQSHGEETINYLALESGTLDFTEYDMLVGAVSSVTHQVTTIGVEGYEMMLAAMQTRNGGDAAQVRVTGNVGSGPGIFIEEEQSKDSETRHIEETVGCAFTKSIISPVYEIEFIAGDNGSLNGSQNQTVSSGGSSTEIEAIADANYHFLGWSDGNVENPRTLKNVEANVALTALFVADSYTVIFNTDGNGTIAGESSQSIDLEIQLSQSKPLLQKASSSVNGAMEIQITRV